METATRAGLLRRGPRFESLTDGWNVVEGAVATAAAAFALVTFTRIDPTLVVLGAGVAGAALLCVHAAPTRQLLVAPSPAAAVPR